VQALIVGQPFGVSGVRRGRPHRLTDLLTSQSYDRDGDELVDPGLFVALEPWQIHVLEVAEVFGSG
jgi:hypothetical protein